MLVPTKNLRAPERKREFADIGLAGQASNPSALKGGGGIGFVR